MKINRKIGNDFETAFCEILSDCGYKVLNLKDIIENALALEDWL